MEVDSNEIPYLRPERSWNNDSAWIEFIEALTATIETIAAKYTEDHALREDAVQNAKIELLQKYPEEVRGYEEYCRGEISLARWQEVLRSYCLTVSRNEILTTLSSYSTGNIYVGRVQVIREENPDGSVSRTKKHAPARYLSLDQLVEDSGLQVSEHGDLSWDLIRENDYGDEDGSS